MEIPFENFPKNGWTLRIIISETAVLVPFVLDLIWWREMRRRKWCEPVQSAVSAMVERLEDWGSMTWMTHFWLGKNFLGCFLGGYCFPLTKCISKCQTTWLFNLPWCIPAFWNKMNLVVQHWAFESNGMGEGLLLLCRTVPSAWKWLLPEADKAEESGKMNGLSSWVMPCRYKGGMITDSGVEPKIGGFYHKKLKCMVKIMEKPMNKWMIWGYCTHIFWKHPDGGFTNKPFLLWWLQAVLLLRWRRGWRVGPGTWGFFQLTRFPPCCQKKSKQTSRSKAFIWISVLCGGSRRHPFNGKAPKPFNITDSQDLIRRELGAVALALSQQQRDTAQESMVQAGWLADLAGWRMMSQYWKIHYLDGTVFGKNGEGVW